jgi:sugar lactone lactonase YvrE
VTQVADDMWFPNGSVFTDDGVLLVDETFGNRITAFDIGADGASANRRVWASFGALPSDRDLQAALGQLAVAPDGCGLDAEGALWVADALGGHDGAWFSSAPRRSSSAPRGAPRAAHLRSWRIDVPHAGRP